METACGLGKTSRGFGKQSKMRYTKTMRKKSLLVFLGLLSAVFFFAFVPSTASAAHTVSTIAPQNATVGVPTKFLAVLTSDASSDTISCAFYWNGALLAGMINENTGDFVANTPCVAGDTCAISHTFAPPTKGSFSAWARCLAGPPETAFNVPIPVSVIVADNPPVISGLLVAGDSAPYETTDTTPTISFFTDENAWCRMSTTDASWTSMTSLNDCSGGQGSTFHACTYFASFAVGPHNLYVSCRDSGFNEQTSGTNADVPFKVIAAGVPTALITLQSQSGLTVDVSGASTFGGTPPYDFDWAYGDSSTATGIDPGSHTYATGGPKTITLTVTDSASAVDTASLDVTLTAAATATADFSGAPLSVPVFSPVKFTDASKPSEGQTIITWLWNFGDSNTSLLKNPSHTYATAGTYTVSLAVEDSGGKTDSEIKNNYVIVTAAGSFEITPTGTLNCGTTPVGTPITCNFQAVNGTATTVTISSIASSNPTEFTPSGGPLVTVLPKMTVSLPMTFKAPTAGTRSAVITFTTSLGGFGRGIEGTATKKAGPAEICSGGADEDGDGAIDCADPDCSADPACAVAEKCNDGVDNDGDKKVDCEDSDCSTAPSCKKAGPGVTITFRNPLGSQTLTGLINNIINFIFTIAVIVAPILLVVAGVIFMTAAGDPGKVKTARSMMIWTIVGFGIILISKGLVAVLKGILGI